MSSEYKRQDVRQYVLKVLQSLGGSASRNAIKEGIVADDDIDISYDDVFEGKKSKNGRWYIPFIFDFNFSIINLNLCGYVKDYDRKSNIVLTEKGRSVDFRVVPTQEDEIITEKYWREKHRQYSNKKNAAGLTEDTVDDNEHEEPFDNNEKSGDEWKIEILERIKEFSPKKFESFSRLLLQNMGIKFDSEKGVKMSGDHGIDGYGYVVSDEFRTEKVVVQCKRYTQGSVSEPDIDRFKGVMLSFNADYGIFITTSNFTKQAKEKAVQGSNTVTLIDGEKLVELIEKYQLHITPFNTFTLDDYYYQED